MLRFVLLNVACLAVFTLSIDFFTLNSVLAKQNQLSKIKESPQISIKPAVQFSQIPILGFHDIVNKNNSRQNPPLRRSFDTDYDKDKLVEVLTYLIQKDYWFLTSDELFHYFYLKDRLIPVEKNSQRPIMLTFDDGYEGLYSNLLPLLESLNNKYQKQVKVVLFINPALMGIEDGDLKYTNCNQLKEGLEKGFFDIQSHALTHRNLTKIKVAELPFELGKSKFILRQCLKNKKVATQIAYPYGSQNEKILEYVTLYYETAYLYNNKFFEISNKKNNRYLIPRLITSRDKTVKDLINIIERAE